MKKVVFLLLVSFYSFAQTGIGTTTPVNKLQVETATANPATTGSAANGNLRLSGVSAAHVLDFGLSSSSNYSWIQSRNKTYGTNYSLIINPLGGSVGIGNVSPAGTLEIGSSTGSVPGFLVLNPTTTGTGEEGAEINLKPAPITTSPSAAQTWVIDQVSNNNNPRLRFFPNNSGEDYGLTIKDGGFVGIGVPSPTVKLQVNGDIIANSIAGSSDLRFKTNIRPVENALDKVKSLRGVYFNWDQKAFPTRDFSEKTELGFIAQEVEKVLPEVVAKDKTPEEYRSVKYDKVVALLVEAIKEQQKQIDSLKSQVKKLKRKKK
ncbi:tail fiber domain-containing protein [Aquirufa sp. HETE-83D]|uniref:Tail fiber domain-containing protein n=1 Tax=Aquirufa esocilacus TaxID=3096513 RepID=A0ABW6DJ54_9BACT